MNSNVFYRTIIIYQRSKIHEWTSIILNAFVIQLGKLDNPCLKISIWWSTFLSISIVKLLFKNMYRTLETIFIWTDVCTLNSWNNGQKSVSSRGKNRKLLTKKISAWTDDSKRSSSVIISTVLEVSFLYTACSITSIHTFLINYTCVATERQK